MPKGQRQITARQQRFVHEYIKDRKPGPAAIRAGFTKKNARVQGFNLLQIPHVRAAIDKALAAQEKRLDLSADRTLQEIAKLAFANIRGAFNDDGTLKDIKDIPPEIMSVIAGIDVDELFEGRGSGREQIGVSKRIKTHSKTEALKMLGQYHKLFTEKHELSGPGGLPLKVIFEDAK